MFFRESERRSKGMWMYSVKRITEGAWMESFCEWSMWPLCSSARATPLKIITTARLSVHTLMGSKEVLRTKTLPFITAILRERGRECQNYVGFWPVQALARVRTNTLLAPAEINTSAQADTVAPVVNTSST